MGFAVPKTEQGLDKEAVILPGVEGTNFRTAKFRVLLTALLKQALTAYTDKLPDTNDVLNCT